jgi:hypothetical protein
MKVFGRGLSQHLNNKGHAGFAKKIPEQVGTSGDMHSRRVKICQVNLGHALLPRGVGAYGSVGSNPGFWVYPDSKQRNNLGHALFSLNPHRDKQSPGTCTFKHLHDQRGTCIFAEKTLAITPELRVPKLLHQPRRLLSAVWPKTELHAFRIVRFNYHTTKQRNHARAARRLRNEDIFAKSDNLGHALLPRSVGAYA